MKKVNSNLLLVLLLIVTFIIFIVVIIITKLFSIEELPIQTTGVLFGGVITALITYFLLIGQSKAEELKERNVRVFEEKSEKFNLFITKLWDIWEDRTVSLEELNELLKIVSKDIILYSKPETVNIILGKLNAIADLAKPDKTDVKDIETTKNIQKMIFDIINALADEIGLGGKINNEIEKKLNSLEVKIVPFLIQKDFTNIYFEHFKRVLENSDDVDFSSIKMEKNYFWCEVSNSKVFFRIGPLKRELNQDAHLVIYTDFNVNKNLIKYRAKTKGAWKYYFKDGVWNSTLETVNLNDLTTIGKMFYDLKNNDQIENKAAQRVINLYNHWKSSDGKNIEQVIDESKTI